MNLRCMGGCSARSCVHTTYVRGTEPQPSAVSVVAPAAMPPGRPGEQPDRGVGNVGPDVAEEGVPQQLAVCRVRGGGVEAQPADRRGVGHHGQLHQVALVLRREDVGGGRDAGGRHERGHVDGVREQAWRVLDGPGQDVAAHAVRDRRHRRSAAQRPRLRDEQRGGLVQVRARRGRIGGQRGGIEGPGRGRGGTLGAQPVPGHVDRQRPRAVGGKPAEYLRPAPGPVPEAVQRNRFPASSSAFSFWAGPKSSVGRPSAARDLG
jgi:hypothetical protein